MATDGGQRAMSYDEPPHDPYQQQPQYPMDPYQQQQNPYQQPGYQQQGYPQPGYPQPGYQQPGYPQQGYVPAPMMAASGQTNVMAILSLVFAFVFWPLAIVFGHVAKRQIKERNEEGDGLATAGLVLGYIFGGIGLLVCAFWVIAVVFLANHSSPTTY